MKAYQVFSGDVDKHNRQYFELKGTYLSLDRAMELFNTLVDDETKTGEDRVELTPKYGEDKDIISLTATIVGWEYVDIAKLEIINIAE